VFRTLSDQVSLWEAVLPPELLKLPDELARVDVLLDDPVFFGPNRVRADTTVVPANVSYPTDSGLLAKAIRRISTTGQRIHDAGGAVRTKLRDRSRAAGSRAHGIAAKLRSRARPGCDRVKQRITGELADLARALARDAQRLLANARRLLANARRALRRAKAKAAELAATGFRDAAAGRRRGRLARAVNDLSDLLQATERIVGQTRQRIAGTTPDGATRVVSLHDRQARPIAKGRLGKTR
jgi:IS5 family transposase